MEISSSGNDLNVRVINMTGHSLPTGYPEGRRIWINLRFFDSFDNLIQEHGTYDLNTAELTTDDTKVYETIVGISEKLGNTVGLPPGESFHLVLNNVVLSDNRIPPMGFTNAAFEAIQAAPVNYSYEDGQHWDDTSYAIPECAEKVIATLYHQTTSKEYIEFLRDANVTDDKGQIAYEQWELEGKSAPLIMDTATYEIPITPILGDVNGDGTVNVKDLLFIINSWGECSNPKGCDADINEDGIVDVQDLLTVIASWSACQ